MVQTKSLEAMVREGRHKEVKAELRNLNLKRIPRVDAVAFANLARRVGMGQLSLRILNPIVRAHFHRKNLDAPPTPLEEIEYAASLRGEGALGEAEELLGKIDRAAFPQAGFQLALCDIARWDYASTIVHLNEYLATFREPNYAFQVARINLLHAYIHEEDKIQAARLIRELHKDLKDSGMKLLYQRSLEFAAQLAIADQNWNQATAYLREAGSLLQVTTDSVYQLLLHKWEAVATSLREGAVAAELIEIQNKALEHGAWEIVRDCDYYIGTINRDENRLSRLYFGTPFASYRRKLEKILPSLPEQFQWGAGTAVFDLAGARFSDSKTALTVGHSLHRFLIVLSQDFYKPVPTLTLFSQLFPEEKFNPFTSPNRVQHIIAGVRKWQRENKIQWQVLKTAAGYSLELGEKMSILIPRQPLPVGANELEFHRLRMHFTAGVFTAEQATEALALSRSSVQRLLKWGLEDGCLEMNGKTKHASYRLTG